MSITAEHVALVERIARAVFPVVMGQVTGREPRETYDTTITENREAARDIARAAISEMPQSNELWIGQYMLRPAPKGIWIGRPGGEGGEFPTQHVEDVIAEFYRANF